MERTAERPIRPAYFNVTADRLPASQATLRDWFALHCSDADIEARIPARAADIGILLKALGRMDLLKPSEEYTQADIAWLRSWARWSYADQMISLRDQRDQGDG